MMITGFSGLSAHSHISVTQVFTLPFACGCDQADHHTVLIPHYYVLFICMYPQTCKIHEVLFSFSLKLFFGVYCNPNYIRTIAVFNSCKSCACKFKMELHLLLNQIYLQLTLTFLGGTWPRVYRFHVLIVCPIKECHVQCWHHLSITMSS